MTKKPSPPLWCAAAGGAAMRCFPVSAAAVATDESDVLERGTVEADREPVPTPPRGLHG